MAQLAMEVSLGLGIAIGIIFITVALYFITKPVMQPVYQRLRGQRRSVRIEVYPKTEHNREINNLFRMAIYSAFAHFRRSIAVLEDRLVIRDSSLGYYTDCAYLLSPSENLDIQVELGPITFANFADIIHRYLCPKDFVLQISTATDSKSNYRILANLTLSQNIWRTWDEETTYDEIAIFYQRLVREVVWITSIKSLREAQHVGQRNEADLHLLEGLTHLSAFLMSPANVDTLEKAVVSFEQAKCEPWRYQAELMAAIALSQTQSQPEEAAIRMQELLDRYKHPQSRHIALLYNTAVAKFRLYDRDEDSRHYDEAIQLFEKIHKPILRCYLWFPFKKQSRLDTWTLYLLAQAGIANSLAHKLNVVTEAEKSKLMEKIYNINQEVNKLLTRLNKPLGSRADEIEWRIYNAEAVAELFCPHDLQKGVTAALEGLRIDPLNLPLRANLGSLRLLEAQKAEEQNSYEERDRLLNDAETIFLSLKETGWDPGFVAYRLGKINRGQGKFEEAIKYQDAAKDKDVARTRIQAEIERALAEDNRLSR